MALESMTISNILHNYGQKWDFLAVDKSEMVVMKDNIIKESSIVSITRSMNEVIHKKEEGIKECTKCFKSLLWFTLTKYS